MPEELVEEFRQVIARKMVATESESMPRSAASEAGAPPAQRNNTGRRVPRALLLNRTDTAGVSKGGAGPAIVAAEESK